MTSLAEKIVRACERKGYPLDRGPGEVNIIYVEGMSPDGTANGDRPNAWNDLRVVLTFDGATPKIVKAWEATTEPGRKYTLAPINPAGAARIEFGRYTAWQVGIHREGSPSAHEALRQDAGDVTVARDANQDGLRTGDARDTGRFGINQHGGYDMPPADIGAASAGCLVGRTMEGHREFMALVKSDPRYVADHSFVFATAVIAESDVLAEGLPPAAAAPLPTDLRTRMARQILSYEARRDSRGRLAVYAPPAGDGGGAYEVAGINARYHPKEAAALAALITAGKHDLAEAQAIEFIAAYTDVVSGWHPDPGVEFVLRDCAFNRGPTGAARIFQRSLGLAEDGIVRPGGPTRKAAAVRDGADMIDAIRTARESYERSPVGRDESSKFWRGLVSRWDKATAFGHELHDAAVRPAPPAPAPQPDPTPVPPPATPPPTEDPALAAVIAAIRPVVAKHLAEAEARGRAAGRAEAAAAAPKAPVAPSVGQALGKVPVAGLSISAATAAAIAQSLGAIDWQTLVPILYAAGGLLGIRMLPALGAGAKLLTSVAPLARALAEQAPKLEAAIEAQAKAAAERDRPQARPENLG